MSTSTSTTPLLSKQNQTRVGALAGRDSGSTTLPPSLVALKTPLLHSVVLWAFGRGRLRRAGPGTAPRGPPATARSMALPGPAVAKLVKELRALQNEPIDGVKVHNRAADCSHPSDSSARPPPTAAWKSVLLQVLVSEDNVTDVQAEYEGPGAAQQAER